MAQKTIDDLASGTLHVTCDAELRTAINAAIREMRAEHPTLDLAISDVVRALLREAIDSRTRRKKGGR